MAFTFTVTELRDSGGLQFTGTDDKMTISWSRKFQVEVTATGGDIAENASEYDVLTASGIPIVNRSVYYRNGQIIPFVICRGKSATPNKSLRSLWTVTATYKSQDANQDESANDPQDPPVALTDISPSEEPFLGMIERPLWVDKDGIDIKLPSGHVYPEPVLERVPTLGVKITQYESSITYQQMLDRKNKVNSATYRTKAAGMWEITEVDATEVDVELAGGTTSAALVTYTVMLSPRQYYDRNGSAFVDAGWRVPVARIDNVVFDGANKFDPFMLDGSKVPSLAMVTNTGALLGDGITGVPEYDLYKTQDEIDFTTFLQV